MKNMTKLITQALMASAVLVMASSFADTAEQEVDAHVEQGREIAFDRRKGNCLACHAIEGGELAGNYGPPLIMMQARFPDRDILRAQIWDASTRMPDTRMPPYGRHRILTEEEIDLVVDFLLTL